MMNRQIKSNSAAVFLLSLAHTLNAAPQSSLENIRVDSDNVDDMFKYAAAIVHMNVDFPARSFAEPEPGVTTHSFQAPKNLAALSTTQAIQQLENMIGKPFDKNIDTLPKSGECDRIPWPSDFFPAVRDGINFKNDGQESAAAKYGQAFGPSSEEVENEVSSVAGIDRQAPQDRPCTENSECVEFQDGSVCAKREGETSGYCVPTWFGLCHAWTPASILEEEPGACPVEENGVQFGVMDIKALLIQSYDGSDFDTVFTGRRCMDTNGTDNEPLLDDYGRYVDPDCRDLSPDFFHVATTNLIGIEKKSYIADITANLEVWNQPIRGYNILSQEEVTVEQALARVHPNIDLDNSLFPNDSTKFVAFTMDMLYITEAAGPDPLVSTGLVDRFTVKKTYDYILSFGPDGELNGGEWTGSAKVDHPDFIWVPTGKPASDSTVAGIRFGDVENLLQKSRDCANP